MGQIKFGNYTVTTAVHMLVNYNTLCTLTWLSNAKEHIQVCCLQWCEPSFAVAELL